MKTTFVWFYRKYVIFVLHFARWDWTAVASWFRTNNVGLHREITMALILPKCNELPGQLPTSTRRAQTSRRTKQLTRLKEKRKFEKKEEKRLCTLTKNLRNSSEGCLVIYWLDRSTWGGLTRCRIFRSPPGLRFREGRAGGTRGRSSGTWWPFWGSLLLRISTRTDSGSIGGNSNICF